MGRKKQEDIPADDIDRFYDDRDKIYLDDYQANRMKKTKAKEFMPLSSGKIWSASEDDDDDIDDYDDDDYDNDTGLTATHKALLKQDKLNQFKKSMGSDFEDSEGSDEDNGLMMEEQDDTAGLASTTVSVEKVKKEKPVKRKAQEEIDAWGGKKKMYYGGEEDPDRMNSDDEEMTLAECQRLRGELAVAAHLTHPLVMAAQPDLYDLVYAAGGSRFPLIIHNGNTDSSLSIKTREEEAESYMRHSMPIFVTPDPSVENNEIKMKTYLSELYPDMVEHYYEYATVKRWLETVWEPLYTSYLESNKISPDSIAGQFILQRKSRMEVFKEGLSLYYQMRQEQKPMFKYHPIYKALIELKMERKSNTKQDQAFLLLAGNVLLKNKDSNKSFKEMAKDLPGKTEFLRCVLSPEEEKRLAKNTKKFRQLEKSSEDVERSNSKVVSYESDSDQNGVLSNSSDNDEDEERRPITYQMSKNKGFMIHRPKRDRNPRVKLRHKYKKALIRRKSQVPNVRREDKPYGGEVFGIRAGLIKSRKFK